VQAGAVGLALVLAACSADPPPVSRTFTVVPEPPALRTVPAPEAPDPLALARYAVEGARLHLDFDWVQFIGHPRYLAPVLATRDGGSLIVANRGERPVAVRLDPAGATLWEVDVGRAGYASFEAAGGVETADGVVVAVASSTNPARNPVTRFVGLDANGEARWDVATRGDGMVRSPYPFLGVAQESGDIALEGWLYDGSPGDATPRLRWSATLTRGGRFTAETVGDEPIPSDDRSHLVFERDVRWLPYTGLSPDLWKIQPL
jgi:hypothetical protein